MKTITYYFLQVVFILTIPGNIFAQPQKPIHQQQSEYFASIGQNFSEADWDRYHGYTSSGPLKKVHKGDKSLNKIVFGWQPYWTGTSYNEYDFSLLTDLAYFSYELDAATGNYLSIHGWNTSPVIDAAKAAGVRVSLTVTLFSNHSTFLSSTTSQTTLINNLVSLINSRGAHGVNIDFEGVPGTQKAALTAFMQNLCNRMHAEVPGSLVSVALPAVEWSDVWDEMALKDYVDIFLVMGYDYWWKGSSTAGPVAPKNSGVAWSTFKYNVTKSLYSYLSKGLPKSKLCLAVPYYGIEWQTTDSLLNCPVVSGTSGVSKLYKDAVSLASQKGRQWNRDASVPYIIYKSTNWQQCFYDDATSLAYKYDLVNTLDIAGIGIWALGYDQGRTELWQLLKEKFSGEGNTACSGFFADMGGPMEAYYANDYYTFTLAPKEAPMVSAAFHEFELNTGDVLKAYEGADNTGTLIGAYSGTGNPGVITSNTGELTFEFQSSAATPKKGFQAFWTCGPALESENLVLGKTNIDENLPAKAFVGKFSISGFPWNEFILYGNEHFDHRYFSISKDTLYCNHKLDYEARNSYKIMVLGESQEGVRVFREFSITVNDLDETNSIPGLNQGDKLFTLFPNPGKGLFQLRFLQDPGKTAGAFIEIMDVRGHVKFSTKLSSVLENGSLIDLNILEPGAYIFMLHLGKEKYSKKVIIQR